jgi:hypothetical protein
MKQRLQIESESGLVIFRDASIDAPAERHDEARRALQIGEREGRWFFIDADDAVAYRIDLHYREEPTGLPANRFRRLGGTYLLHVRTGRLAISGLDSWSSEDGVETIDIEPGSYAFSILGSEEFDGPAYDREMRSVIGVADWNHRTRVDRIGLAGCLATVAAAVMIALPVTRHLWPMAIGLLALGWLPFITLQWMPRYRDIERRVRDYEQSLPHYAVRLEKTDTTDNLVGGHLKVG